MSVDQLVEEELKLLRDAGVILPSCPNRLDRSEAAETRNYFHHDWNQSHVALVDAVDATDVRAMMMPDPLLDVVIQRRNARMAADRVQAVQKAESSFRLIGLFLPKRIRDEEIGDAVEDIRRILCDGNCLNLRWAVRWKVISTWFWLFWHAVGRIGAAMRGRKAE